MLNDQLALQRYKKIRNQAFSFLVQFFAESENILHSLPYKILYTIYVSSGNHTYCLSAEYLLHQYDNPSAKVKEIILCRQDDTPGADGMLIASSYVKAESPKELTSH